VDSVQFFQIRLGNGEIILEKCRSMFAAPGLEVSAPAAHDPQIRERLAERIRRRRMEPEYEPAARRERSMNPLQH
jgi:hypothetical protein